MLNDLPLKRTEIILSLLRLNLSTAFHSFVDYEGHFLSGLAGKQSDGHEGDLGLISGLGRFP